MSIRIFRPAAFLCLLLAGACGNSGPTTNLKPVFFRNVPTAPVVTLTMLRHDGITPLTRANVTFDARAMFDGWLKVGRTASASANASGVASIALTQGSYPMYINPQTANVGSFNDLLDISADTSRTYQTSQQSWTVTSPKAFSAIEIVVYQTDGNGRALVGTTSTSSYPMVLDITPAVAGGNATTATFTTELFKGSYRAMVFATPVTSTDTLEPFETSLFSPAGGGATETQTVALKSAGNLVSLHLSDGPAPVPDNQIASVGVYDASSLFLLGSSRTTNGVATVNTGDVTNVMVVVTAAGDGHALVIKPYTASPTLSDTLTRYDVTGHVKPPGSATITGGGPYGNVTAALQTGLGDFWDKSIASVPGSAAITDAQGTYDLKLFAGSYSLKASNVPSLPPSSPVSLSVSAAVPAQDINVAAGGTITGAIQDAAKTGIAGVNIAAYDSNHLSVTSATTDATGNYSLLVPYGTYELIASGAITSGVSVNAASGTTVNLTRFQVTGRLTDSAQNAVAGRIYWGGGNATASTLGTYTINVMQGLNWFLFTPPATSPSLAFQYETQALVTGDTVKSLL